MIYKNSTIIRSIIAVAFLLNTVACGSSRGNGIKGTDQAADMIDTRNKINEYNKRLEELAEHKKEAKRQEEKLNEREKELEEHKRKYNY